MFTKLCILFVLISEMYDEFFMDTQILTSANRDQRISKYVL